MALEELYFGQNVRTAFAVGQARGVVLLAAGQHGLPCASYTPQQVKGAVCGSGRAQKDQVARMVQTLLGLAELPRPDHAADALAVAVCHANGAPLALTLVTSTGNQERDAIAAIVQDDWKRLGVDLTIKHYPATMLYNTYAAGGILERGRFDVEQSHQGYGLFGDETQIWACASQPPVAVNTSHYCNPKFDRALAAFKQEYDPARSQHLADTFQEQLAQDIPTVVLFIARDLYIASNDFKGLHPGCTFDGSENWTI